MAEDKNTFVIYSKPQMFSVFLPIWLMMLNLQIYFAMYVLNITRDKVVIIIFSMEKTLFPSYGIENSSSIVMNNGLESNSWYNDKINVIKKSE